MYVVIKTIIIEIIKMMINDNGNNINDDGN